MYWIDVGNLRLIQAVSTVFCTRFGQGTKAPVPNKVHARIYQNRVLKSTVLERLFRKETCDFPCGWLYMMRRFLPSVSINFSLWFAMYYCGGVEFVSNYEMTGGEYVLLFRLVIVGKFQNPNAKWRINFKFPNAKFQIKVKWREFQISKRLGFFENGGED